ncbi:MAG: phosphate signaling complex protein PhoU [Furfurilactobacillus sp.]|jgi:phosphate transport system protein|uniref:Phosphate-specific transport system accessory protein PhoU n=1 Tax=Furfurilactobacillus milii TaxID=2888272 RepID=A0A6N9I5N0_9LACO|nr:MULTISPECIES: phosphate signaling complex protein PhoU [Furfurilactobacillus]QLE67110.1 Phosphate transport system regulatory protein PhoU [Furfurilactobacillus rossiae]MCF6161465.1 phosphate signaling complex protein PhoU [Furfurilactobacillus milii]MCF6163844.1 phosphate signaling complex protein PhoU [Furfurilactobacillus milii]MCF6418880.1 phosphate signaling complex protein PhoU [Furfurilactobacillus milii]MCH4011307.1 phosphate signaling complex protein PhoU [Furfurilactobacillus sp.]
MRRLFDDELNDLDTSFTEMGMLVSEAIGKAVTSFVNHDRTLAQSVIDDDHLINDREVALEKKSFEMIALYQPVTTDLREIVTILKAVSDLERMGDYARSIAHSTIRVKGNKRVASTEQHISEMGAIVQQMVADVLDAYVKDDDGRARKIAAVDAQAADYYQLIYMESIDQMRQDPEVVIGSTDYLSVAQFLKRIGDYVTNICEWIVYLQTGKIVELNPRNVDSGTENK